MASPRTGTPESVFGLAATGVVILATNEPMWFANDSPRLQDFGAVVTFWVLTGPVYSSRVKTFIRDRMAEQHSSSISQTGLLISGQILCIPGQGHDVAKLV